MNHLKILILEDSESDAELLQLRLQENNFDFEAKTVDTREEFTTALSEFAPDLILSDHTLPQFNSIEALKIVKHESRKIPFILVTGSVSEEFAIKSMHEGADDYILKDRLGRLPDAIFNALEKHRLEKERQQYMESLKKSEANLKTIFDNTNVSFLLLDANFKIISFNQPALRNSESNLSMPLKEGNNFIDYLPVEKRTRIKEKYGQVLSGEHFKFEVSFPDPDKSLKWYEMQLLPILDKEQQIHGLLVMMTNITEQKIAELQREKITSDLIQRNKDLEQFAYILSHNLRLPVANILGFSEVLQQYGVTSVHAPEIISGLYNSAQRLDNVIIDLNDILQMRREINQKRETVHFSELVSDIKLSLDTQVKQECIELKVDFAAIDEMVTIKSYVYSIFYNLISNSIKYRRPGDKCSIEIKSVLTERGVKLIFKDNGMGMNLNKIKGNLFGLYKRFHLDIEGKGMGLFLVKSQVEALGGTIDVNSEENFGSEFIIDFTPED